MSTSSGNCEDYPLPGYARAGQGTVGLLREVLRHVPSETRVADLAPGVQEQLQQLLVVSLPAKARALPADRMWNKPKSLAAIAASEARPKGRKMVLADLGL